MQLWDSTNEDDREKLSDSIADAENELPIPARAPLENASWRRPTLADVQRVIAPSETLLEYVVGEDASYCLAISKTGVEIFQLPAGKTVDALVDRYLSAVKNEADAKAEGRELYSSILNLFSRWSPRRY